MRSYVCMCLLVICVKSKEDDLLSEIQHELKKMLDLELTLPVQKRISDDLLQIIEGSGEADTIGESVIHAEGSTLPNLSTLLTTTSTQKPTTTETTTTTTTITSTTTVTSTTSPATTTRTKASGSSKRTKVCVTEAQCLGDHECGKGRCSGTHLGRCNCRACIPTKNCTDDSECGGLRDSCHLGSCHCQRALALHGFPLMVDALLTFCGVKTCSINGDDCHGLPCNTGKCICKGVN